MAKQPPKATPGMTPDIMPIEHLRRLLERQPASKGTIVLDLDTILSCANDEVFTFQGTDRGKREVYHFNATKIREYIEANKAKDPSVATFQVVPLTEEHVNHIRMNNGVEVAKLARLAKEPDIYCQPILVCDMGFYGGHDWHIQIDGNHRAVLLYGMGMRHIGAYMVPEKTWRKFLVNLPDDPDFIDACLS